MSNEMKTLLVGMIKYDIPIGGIFTFILALFVGLSSALIFSLGLIVAILNFIISGIILEKTLKSDCWINGILFPMSYIFRIVAIILIAMPFMHDIRSISMYILGFIMHFPILIFSWLRKQKGSE